jgi:hypothetical protein
MKGIKKHSFSLLLILAALLMIYIALNVDVPNLVLGFLWSG